MFHPSPKMISQASALALVAILAIPTLAAAETAASPAVGAQAAPRSATDPVETRIAQLHDKLQISEAEAGQWDAVAKTMRANAKAIGDLVQQKRRSEQSMTALDDLHAYQEIAEAHAKGAKKLADAFQVLYATMSDDQKKVADAVFRQHKQDVMAASR